MDASALALSLDRSRGSGGAVSLRELRTALMRSGLEEFARAVDSLTERLSPIKLTLENEIVPWF